LYSLRSSVHLLYNYYVKDSKFISNIDKIKIYPNGLIESVTNNCHLFSKNAKMEPYPYNHANSHANSTNYDFCIEEEIYNTMEQHYPNNIIKSSTLIDKLSELTISNQNEIDDIDSSSNETDDFIG